MMGFFASIIALAIVPHTSNLDNYQFPKIKGYQKEGEAIAVGGNGNEHAEENNTFGLALVWVCVCVCVCERERERERTRGSFYDGDQWWIDMVVLEIDGDGIWLWWSSWEAGFHDESDYGGLLVFWV